MEKLLKDLFDFQRFVLNPDLQALLDDTERRYGEDIADGDLAFFAAAGEPGDGWPLLRPKDLNL